MEFKIYRTTEAELIKGCLRREREAQKRLFDTYSPPMYALCFRYLKDTMQAEDVVVRAFAKILDRISQYKGEGSFEGWIRKVVVNEALVLLRKNRSLFVETDLEAAELEPNYQSLSDHLEAEDIMNMIRDLPEGYRTVFNLYANDGYSHKEIAEQLGISENTSKSQLSRARNHLKKLLIAHDWVSKKQINDTAT